MNDETTKDAAQASWTPAQRAEDARKALSEYEAAQEAERAKTARLRAARLAKEAAEAAARPAASPRRKKAVRQTKQKAVGLSDWLNDQQSSGRRS